MADPSFSTGDLALSEWVDEVADRFEAAWRGLTPPALEDFLGEATGDRRAALLAELQKIDRAYRHRLTAPAAPPGPAPPQTWSSQPTLPLKTDWPDLPGYEILGELGHGGMGVVYLARQKGLPRRVALKMLPAGAVAAGRERRRFLAEAEAVARLQHPNIVPIYEVGEHAGRPFFVLEYVAGGSLAQRLSGQPQPAPAAARLVEVLARAVHFAHEQHIVHRDLKPANVLLEEGPETPLERCTPKVSDFGLAKELNCAEGMNQTRTGEILGTPSYMAPEQASGKVKDVGPAADVYGLGAILYELLTGRPPFRGETALDTLEQVRTQEPVPPSRLQPKLPRDLSTICLKALAKETARRYATAGALADDLRRFLDGRPIMARQVGRAEKLWRWCRRNPWVALLTVLVAVSLLAGTSVSTVFLVQSQERAQEILREQERVREEKRQTARRRYLSDMHLPPQYWEAGRVDLLLDRLRRQRPEHTEGEDLRGFEWYYWHHRCYDMRILARLTGTRANGVAYSPDGTRIAHGAGQTVRILDAKTGQGLHSLSTHPGAVDRVVFSADGKWLAATANDDTTRVWDTQKGDLIQTLKGGWGVAIHPYRPRLASGGKDGTVRVWDLANGQEQARYTLRGNVHSIAISPDGKRIAIGSGIYDKKTGSAVAGELKVWDLEPGRERIDIRGHTRAVLAVAFSPDGKWLASAGGDRTVRLWDAATGKESRLLRGHKRMVWRIAFSQDGRLLASGSNDQTIRVWETASGKQLLILRGHAESVNGLAFSPDGKRLASAGDDGTIRVWDAVHGREPLTLCGHRQEVYGVAFDPKTDDIVTASEDGTAKLWKANTGQEIRTFSGHKACVNGVSFSQDGKLLATASDDGTGKVWDTSTGREKFTLAGHTYKVWAVVFSPDGRRLVSASEDKTMRFWDASTGRETFNVLLEDQLNGVAFSPDGKRLATAGWNSLKVWDSESGREVRTLRGHTGSVWCAAFSRDGKWLATASNDATVKLWDVDRGEELRTFRGHTEEVSCVVFSPDGRRLASAGWDGTVKLWDIDSGEEVLTLKGRGERVFCVAFSRDGQRLASTNSDGTVQIWAAPPPPAGD